MDGKQPGLSAESFTAASRGSAFMSTRHAGLTQGTPPGKGMAQLIHQTTEGASAAGASAGLDVT